MLSSFPLDLVQIALVRSIESTTTLTATSIQAARERLNTTAANMMKAPDAHNSRIALDDRGDREYNSKTAPASANGNTIPR